MVPMCISHGSGYSFMWHSDCYGNMLIAVMALLKGPFNLLHVQWIYFKWMKVSKYIQQELFHSEGEGCVKHSVAYAVQKRINIAESLSLLDSWKMNVSEGTLSQDQLTQSGVLFYIYFDHTQNVSWDTAAQWGSPTEQHHNCILCILISRVTCALTFSIYTNDVQMTGGEGAPFHNSALGTEAACIQYPALTESSSGWPWLGSPLRPKQPPSSPGLSVRHASIASGLMEV